MIKLNVFHQPNIDEEHVDIYYRDMQPTIRKVIDLVGQEQKIIWGKTEDEKISISIDSICYIESVDKRSFAYLLEEVYEIEGTLAELEERLYDYGFIRISKSHIVNIYQIKALKPEANMKVCATFANGEKIYINRSYKKAFHAYLVQIRGKKNEK